MAGLIRIALGVTEAPAVGGFGSRIRGRSAAPTFVLVWLITNVLQRRRSGLRRSAK
jgi:hypothetical protein